MPSASTTSPFAGSAAIESSLCERTMPGSVQVAISSCCARSDMAARVRGWRPSKRRRIRLAADLLSRTRISSPPLPLIPGPHCCSLMREESTIYRSNSKYCPRLDRPSGKQFSGRDFFAVAELGAQHLDAAALGRNLKALVRDFHHLADLALDRAERAHRMLARVEDLQFLPFDRRPGAGRGVAAADRVVDEVDVVRPPMPSWERKKVMNTL